MRVLLWLIVVGLLVWAGLQFWRAWRLGAFGGMGRAARTRRAPAPVPDASVFNLPEGLDVTGARSEPVFAQPAWADMSEPVFAPPAPAASPQAPSMPAPPPFAAPPAPSPFPPQVPNFAPQPVSMAAAPPFVAPETETEKMGDMDIGATTGESTATRDEVLQMFGRDLRALRHAIEVQRNTLSRLEEDLHMLENHLNGRQAPVRRS